jgi:hypothetical protein
MPLLVVRSAMCDSDHGLHDRVEFLSSVQKGCFTSLQGDCCYRILITDFGISSSLQVLQNFVMSAVQRISGKVPSSAQNVAQSGLECDLDCDCSIRNIDKWAILSIPQIIVCSEAHQK